MDSTQRMTSPGSPPLRFAEDATHRPVISVVTPAYNEAGCVDELARRLRAALDSITPSWEVMVVENGSEDDTWERLRAIQAADPRFKLLRLPKNFGHQLGVTAGLDFVNGETVVIIDADLQDPPELIPTLYARLKDGYDVVYAVRAHREKETFFKLASAKAFYRLFRWVTDIDMPADTGDFRIMNRRVVDALSRMRERHRMLRAMVSWTGYRSVGVPYERAGRFAGSTKYPLARMIRFALDGVFSFSSLPLRVASWIGALVSVISFAYALYAVSYHFGGGTVAGWASIVVAVTFLGGVQLLCLGILGEYIGRIYEEVKGRPLYVVADFISEPPSAEREASDLVRAAAGRG